uniref:ABC transporter ATP-binding protein n=1 Tax=Eubacterium sp. TaxID=142586 RepID=UPI00402973F2
MNNTSQAKELKVNNLSVSYDKNEVLKGLSFTASGLCAVIGKNGCGKTTLLKAVACLLKSSGNIELGDTAIKSSSLRQRARIISYIPQKTGVSDDMSVLDVVASGYNARLSVFENPSSKQLEKAKAALELVGLNNIWQRNYSSLSAGQQQLCILARTVVEDTQLWLLDEPDSALDITNRYSVMSLLAETAKEKGITGIVSLHDPTLALEFCDTVIAVENGRCAGIINTSKDGIEHIEKVLKKAYGDVCLVNANGRYAVFPSEKLMKRKNSYET